MSTPTHASVLHHLDTAISQLEELLAGHDNIERDRTSLTPGDKVQTDNV